MDTFYINKKNYYFIDDIRETHPNLFKGCKSNRELITKKKFIPNNKYLYAKYDKSNDTWVVTNGSSRKLDKLFIRKKFFDELQIEKTIDYEDLPDEIILEANEKFVDNDSNIVEIKVVGERDVDKCYFCVKDFMDGFDLPNLHTIIIKNGSTYEENIHYKYFYSEKITISKNRKKKLLYLTYCGVLKTLFGSTKKTTNKFVTWATTVLFTTQLGTSNQKEQLVSNLLSVSVDTVKAVFSKSSHTIPCVYLFSIGKVSELRKSMKISEEYDENSYVYKYGMTIDLERRVKEHTNTFKKIKGTNLELTIFSYIDTQYISNAEQKVKELMQELNYVFEYEKMAELAIIPDNKFKFVKNQFELISSMYIGRVADLVNKLKEKESEILLIKEKHKNEMLLEQHKSQLLEKELEIIKLKNKM